VLALLAALLIAVVTAISTVPAIENRMEVAALDIERYRAGNPNSSVGYRFEMYKSLAIIIPQKPWLGWSYEDYEAEQHRLVETGRLSEVIIKMASSHSTAVQAWVCPGRVGLAVLLALLVVAFAYFCRRLRVPNGEQKVAATWRAALTVGYGIFSVSQ